MCLLVVRKKGNWLPSKEEFSNAWSSNPDGFGLAYHTKREGLMQFKTLSKEEAFESLSFIPSGAPALLHWRYGTHGSITLENVHPFGFRDAKNVLWIGAHNGVLHLQECLEGRTDSESYLRTLRNVTVKQIEGDIARLGGGKIACLSEKGQLVLANEKSGWWRRTGEVWQSNGALDATPWHGWQPRQAWNVETLTRLRCAWCHGTSRIEWEDGDGAAVCDDCASDILETQRGLE